MPGVGRAAHPSQRQESTDAALVQDVGPHYTGASVSAGAMIFDINSGIKSFRVMDRSKST